MSDERLGEGSPSSPWSLRAGWLAERPQVQVALPVADQAGRLEPLPGDLLLVRALLAQKLLAQARPARKRTRSPGKIGLAGAEVVQAPAEQVALQVRWMIPEHW